MKKLILILSLICLSGCGGQGDGTVIDTTQAPVGAKVDSHALCVHALDGSNLDQIITEFVALNPLLILPLDYEADLRLRLSDPNDPSSILDARFELDTMCQALAQSG